MNLDGLFTRTRVRFDPGLDNDRLTLDGAPAASIALERVQALLVRIRSMAGISLYAQVESENNFPSGTGLASSASAFAALSLAAARAAGLQHSESELSRLARTASGSACRSVPAGFVEWQAGTDHQSSFAYSIAPPSHWQLADCIAIVSREHKSTGSHAGHELADSSPLQSARLLDATRRLDLCRRAILERDFEALAEVVELDSNMMHAVIMTSTPRLQYWLPATLTIMLEVTRWRRSGQPVCYTIDAGPNVHVLCESDFARDIREKLASLPGVLDTLVAHPGGGTRLDTGA